MPMKERAHIWHLYTNSLLGRCLDVECWETFHNTAHVCQELRAEARHLPYPLNALVRYWHHYLSKGLCA
jgi:hypothetical protein